MASIPVDVRLTDTDIRYLFSILDIYRSGEINKKSLLKFANTGVIDAASDENTLSRYDDIPSLPICIQRVSGIDASLLEKVFNKIPKNTPLKLGFLEFLHYLNSEGMGRNKRDAENLYIALGGDDTHGADIGLLLNTVVKLKLQQAEDLKNFLPLIFLFL